MPSIGAPEIILIILVIVLLFGAKKLPELARGSGRALRIFKAETKGLVNDDDDDATTETTRDAHGRPLPPGKAESTPPVTPRPEPTREPVQDRPPRDQT